jgi:MFS family permease
MADVSYTGLLRHNRNFRYLWFGQLVSQLGDWFNSVAVYSLLLELTGGSATAVAWMMVVQFLPVAIVGPLAGVAVDRFNRRRILIATDLLRGVLVLGLLLVRRPEHMWLAYAVMGATVSATAFFEPARTATLPNITTREELLPANALASASWSAMLAIGAALGGLVTALVGRDVAFTFNSVSFFASALLISRTTFAGDPPSSRRTTDGHVLLTTTRDLADGVRYVRAHAHVAALMLVKAGWGIAGGAFLLITIFGERVFPVAGSPAAGIGILFGARGVGAGLGGLLTKALGHDARRLRRAIAPAYLVYGGFYLVLAAAPSLWVAGLAVLGAHGAGAVLWVASTVLLQHEVPDAFRGRVFSAELAFVTFVASVASYVTAYGLDHLHLTPRVLAAIVGVLFCVPGFLWLMIDSRWQKLEPVAAPAATPPVQDEMLGTRG